ncbi:hypothetical protein ESCO_003319 [Escovopsis weberi]|uniref:Uncharacterized protein n=1 Tax=Escovopsis weberi TaxID=150374 RepID=A0A0M8N204_ESCWE|nr:hypothetical protein ESCO_003319 [Escovopsis weberi]
MADRPNDPATVPGQQEPQPKMHEETKPKMFDKEGMVGKQFTEKGSLGGMAQKMGGPMDKEGMVGKQFTAEGMLGGTVQNAMGGEKKTMVPDKKHDS